MIELTNKQETLLQVLKNRKQLISIVNNEGIWFEHIGYFKNKTDALSTAKQIKEHLPKLTFKTRTERNRVHLYCNHSIYWSCT